LLKIGLLGTKNHPLIKLTISEILKNTECNYFLLLDTLELSSHQLNVFHARTGNKFSKSSLFDENLNFEQIKVSSFGSHNSERLMEYIK